MLRVSTFLIWTSSGRNLRQAEGHDIAKSSKDLIRQDHLTLFSVLAALRANLTCQVQRCSFFFSPFHEMWTCKKTMGYDRLLNEPQVSYQRKEFPK